MSSFMAPRQRVQRSWLLVILSILCVLVLVTIGVIVYLFSTHTGLNGKSTEPYPGIVVINGPDNDPIGISDGSYAFDTARSGGSFKQQAAEKLQQGDRSAALALWHNGLLTDSNDAEALIYQEDQSLVAAGKPFMTLVVGTMLTGNNPSAISSGRDVLQGAYVAQKEYNDSLQSGGGRPLRLLIANSGSRADNATNVAQLIVQAARLDKTIIGVMGWPFSEQALNVVKILSAAKIPMVSTASSDALTGISPYFFRVAPSNKTQAIAGALYVKQQLQAHRIAVFVDPNDAYSSSLANDFSTQFTDNTNKIVDTEEYKVGDTNTLSGLLQNALNSNPDLIYFAGYASDLTKLLEIKPDLQVMGGDALYEPGGYSSNARNGFSHLHFTSFGYPDEWGIEGQPAPSFFSLFGQDLDPLHTHSGLASPYGFSRPTNDAMLAYDAMKALLKGYINIGQASLTPSALQQGLAKIYGNQAIQGVTGQISFGSNGDPVNKAIVVLYVASGFVRVVDNHGIQGCFILGQCSNIN